MSKVLVVDDEPHIVRLVSFTLKKHGYEVVEAVDGFAAIDLAEKEQPDLILMDVMMPVMNGYDTCRRLRENERTCEIPVVMLSAKSQKAEVEAGMASGALDYITKPFTPKDLVAEVSRVIETEKGKGREGG